MVAACGFLMPSILADVSGGKAPASSLRAVGAEAKVPCGGTVEILMESSPNYHNQVYFEIITPPSHGFLSMVRPMGEHSASVIYKHDASEEAGEDRFFFRVRSTGRAPSSPTPCSIRIMPRPGCLEVEPDRLDFGSCFMGQAKTMSVTLSNSGGSGLEAIVSASKPFRIQNEIRAKIEKAGTREFMVEFSPQTEGAVEGQLLAKVVSGVSEKRVRLFGMGVPAFSVVAHDGGTLLTLSNQSPASLLLTFSEPTGWSHPPDLVLPPRSSRQVRLSNSGGVDEIQQNGKAVAEFSRALRISDGAFATNHQLPAMTSMPPLVLEDDGKSFPGNVEPGMPVAYSFGISNPADRPRSFSIKVEPLPCGSIPVEELRRIDLPPRESIRIDRVWTPASVGSNSLTLSVLEEGVRDSVPLKRTWNVIVGDDIPPKSSATSTATALPQGGLSGNTSQHVQPGERISSEPLRDSPIPECNALCKRPWFGGPELIISWKKGLSIREAEIWQLVPSVNAADPDQLVRGERLAPELMFEQKTRQFIPAIKNGMIHSLLIRGLDPGTALFRVLLHGEGDCGDLESLVQVEMPAVGRGVRSVLYFFIALATLVAALRFFRKRR